MRARNPRARGNLPGAARLRRRIFVRWKRCGLPRLPLGPPTQLVQRSQGCPGRFVLDCACIVGRLRGRSFVFTPSKRSHNTVEMRATVVSRMRATVAAFAAKEKDIYRLNPLGPKPKRVLGVVYNSQARRAGP